MGSVHDYTVLFSKSDTLLRRHGVPNWEKTGKRLDPHWLETAKHEEVGLQPDSRPLISSLRRRHVQQLRLSLALACCLLLWMGPVSRVT